MRIVGSPASLLLGATVALGACMATPTPPAAGDDLLLGDQPEDDKADGNWGSALTCKPIPDLPQLVDPRITVSINGLTVHLVDPVTGFDKVFPTGAGQIETDDDDPAYGESKSYFPVIKTGQHDFAIHPNTVNACRIWWTDPDSHQKAPVFAGLPFMPFFGNFAFHGPIDNYRAKNGGSLRRGFVSHGCFRMQADDIAEIYARVKSLANVPVHVQREPERLAGGVRVDLASRFIGAECSDDDDCNYAGGFCHANPYGGRGFCSARCTSTCAARPGAAPTFCVADPLDAKSGMCVLKTNVQNLDCRAFGQMQPKTVARLDGVGKAEVCLPGSRGWLGDPCLEAGDCHDGGACYGASAERYGYCSEACVLACPDEPGFAATTCIDASVSGLGRGCARSCSVASNGSECEGDSACVRRAPNDPDDHRYVCRRLYSSSQK